MVMAFSNDSKLLDSGHFVYTIHSVIPLAKKKSFEDLQHRMNEAACCFDGYRGSRLHFRTKTMDSICWPPHGSCLKL